MIFIFTGLGYLGRKRPRKRGAFLFPYQIPHIHIYLLTRLVRVNHTALMALQ